MSYIVKKGKYYLNGLGNSSAPLWTTKRERALVITELIENRFAQGMERIPAEAKKIEL
jgi:hypothetical protein